MRRKWCCCSWARTLTQMGMGLGCFLETVRGIGAALFAGSLRFGWGGRAAVWGQPGRCCFGASGARQAVAAGAHTGAVDAFGIDSTAVLALGACAAELAAFTSFTPLRQLPQVRNGRVCVSFGTQTLSPAAALLVAPEIAPSATACHAPPGNGGWISRGCTTGACYASGGLNSGIPPARPGKGLCAPGRWRALSGAEQRSGAGPLVCAGGHTQASSSSFAAAV